MNSDNILEYKSVVTSYVIYQQGFTSLYLPAKPWPSVQTPDKQAVHPNLTPLVEPMLLQQAILTNREKLIVLHSVCTIMQ